MIRVVQADLATLSVQGIVRAVRPDLSGVDATARDLVAGAGPRLADRLERAGVIPVGGAVLTPAGELAADFMIHVVVMSDDEPLTSLSIQRALRNGLRRAADWGVESLAVPPLGLGAGSIEPEVPARVLVDVLFDHLDEGAPPLDLTIAVSSEFEAALFEQLVAAGARARGSVHS